MSRRQRYLEVNNNNQMHKLSRVQNNYLFSVIIAAYNVGEYLDDAIDSLINQTISFERFIEVIIVNDGSVDNTQIVAEKWKKRFPNNVKVIKQDNQGVSVARNAGLKIASGQYVNFLDGDDKFDQSVFLSIRMFFSQHSDVKIAKIPIRMFEAKEGEHGLNKVFTKNEEIVHIDKLPKKIFAHIASTFISRDILLNNNISFEVGRKYGEDLALAVRIVEVEKTFALINNVYYNYRARNSADSAMDSSRSDPLTYIPNADMMLDLINKYKDDNGKIDKWLQMLIMYDLGWKIKRENLPFLGTEEWYKKYLDRVTSILHFIDDPFIDAQGHLKWIQKEAIKWIKYSGKWPSYTDNIGNAIVKNNDVELCNGNKSYLLSKLVGKIFVAKYRPETDSLDFLIVIEHLWGSGKLTLSASDGEKQFQGKIVAEPARQKMISIPIHGAITYEFHIPLTELENTNNLQFLVQYENLDFQRKLKTEFSGMLVSIGEGIKKNYIWAKSKLLKFDFNNNKFLILNNTLENLQFLENDIKKSILVSKISDSRKKQLITLRMLALKSKSSTSIINIFQDRENKADDNAEVLYQTIAENHPEWQNYFILERESSDWERLQRLNFNLIEYGSTEHERLLIQATNLISSQADLTIMRPWPRDFGYLRDAYHYNFVFLQHGVTKHDLSLWLRKIEKDIRLLVTVSRFEQKGFLDYGYQYDENEIVLTGFPRFDRYTSMSQDSTKNNGVILIAPTWRNGIWKESDSHSTKIEKIKNTHFFNAWQCLLNSDKIKSLVENGNEIVWLPHPHFREVDDAFKIPNYVKEASVDIRYVDILKKASVLVTDFSSIYFDIAYQNKPTIYYQMDDGNVNNKPGYFDFKTMGFGKVFDNLKEVENELQLVVNNGFVLEDKYYSRVKEFFAFGDQNNSKRVQKNIENMVRYEHSPLAKEEIDFIFSTKNSTSSLAITKSKEWADSISLKKMVKKVLKKDSQMYFFAKSIYKKTRS